jgi:hypothetical protein
VLCPECSRSAVAQDTPFSGFGSPATVAFDSDGDLIACYEVQRLPLATVAASLIDKRTHCAQIASRLHTRRDVDWEA